MKTWQHIAVYIVLIFIAAYSGYVSIIKTSEVASQNKALQTQLKQAQYDAIKYKQMYRKAAVRLLASQHYSTEKMTNWIMQHSTKCSRRMARAIASWCDDKDLCLVLLAVIAQESSFNPMAKSSAGAIGLGQVMPLWVPELVKAKMLNTKRDLYSPFYNITCTEYVLKKYIKKANGDLVKALTLYLGAKNNKYVNGILQNLGSLILTLNVY